MLGSSSFTTGSSDAAGAVRPLEHWLHNQRHDAGPGDVLDVINPATGAVCAQMPVAGGDLVDHAVAAAAVAARDWSQVSIGARTQLMFRFRELVAQHTNELAELITQEHGKVKSDALGEIARGLEVIDFACGAGQLLKGEASSQASTGIDVRSCREPLGVVAGITPFNFPAMVPLWMFPLAIMAGNAFILKPSEQDPSPALMLAELFADAGLPAGVLSVLHGDHTTVDAIVRHPGIAAVSFVGSTPVARHVYATATATGKRVQALGGAKNHAVVLPDADLNLAANALVSAAYGSAGQRCMAISVAVAVGEIADPLVAAIRERTVELKVGPGNNEDSQMGPVISAKQRERIVRLVEGTVAEGAELIVDGRDLHVPGHESGYFVGPYLLDRVRPDMVGYSEEIFGPVLLVVRTGTFDEALDLINRNPYGNGASIFTRDGGAARNFERSVTAGMVGINVPIPVPVAYHSFGGWKESLLGDLHVNGADGVRFYTRGRAVTTRWPDPSTSQIDLGFPRTH